MRILAALSLGAGIGLAAALASIVDAILLRPLPVARPSEILRVFTASESQPLGFVSYPDFEDFRRVSDAVAECLIPVSAGDPAQIRLALAVTPDYFQVLGVRARFGRTFAEGDEMAVVLAQGNAGNIGKTVRIGAKLYTVIGVAPENFGLDRFLHQDLYIPIRSYGDGKILEDRSRRFLTVHVRGANAAPKIAASAARLELEYPKTNRGRRAVVLDEMTARRRTDTMMTPLAELLATLASLLLAIGCANACGALLTRGEARAREIALKMALGAGPIRLFGESLSESGRIAAAGYALALPLAWIVTEALRRSIVLPTDFAIAIDARVDGRAAVLAVMAAILATLICGVIPSSLIAWRMDVWGALKSRERSTGNRGRNLIAMIEIALAAALAATGGSLWAGLAAAKNAGLGYRTNGISVMTFDPGQSGYDEARTREFYRDLLERVKSLPSVRSAALAQSVPLGMTGAQKQVRIGDAEDMTVWMNIVTSDYFELMHIALVAGRVFDDRDRAVAIVNEELAKRVKVGEKMSVAGRMVEVVGVVRTAKYMRWDEAPRPFFYLPYARNYAPRMTLHVESTGPLFDEIRRIAGPIPMSDARLLREYFDNGAMFGVKAALKIASVAGSGGLLLALAGLYGVVSSAVGRRRREIGIRIALGARYGSVFAMVMREGMAIAAIGTAVGLAAGLSGMRLLQALVSGAWSWWAGAVAAGLMIGASAIACAVPAIPALRVDPATVLRED